MLTVPKGLRLQIGIFGRTNVGKSTLLNFIAGQDVAITSPEPGTTTDVVEKTMELLPLGPVVFLDTAGIDDVSALGDKRREKAYKIFERAEIIILTVESGAWTEYEDQIINLANQHKIPALTIVNKSDLRAPSPEYLKKIPTPYVVLSSIDKNLREPKMAEIKRELLALCPESFLSPPPLLADLIPKEALVVLIVPIDIEAPKGRIILPQVQAIRDVLDSDSAVVVVKEHQYAKFLAALPKKPDLVVCDSQVVDKMVAETPADIKCTTFSILLARQKGDLSIAVAGAKAIEKLQQNSKILVAESCSHHALEDDIGRVKIPRWLKEYKGFDFQIDTYAGHDFPKNLKDYQLIIHCGSCMVSRKETLYRYEQALAQNVPITNYGVAIAYLKGLLMRVLEPFNLS